MTIPVRSTFCLFLAFAGTSIPAQFRPGDVFSEHRWHPKFAWQRITGSDTTNRNARANLPNPTNAFTMPDIKGALRVEASVALLTSHHGTTGAKIRVNNKKWVPIPYPNESILPGQRGQGRPVQQYLALRYPRVTIPLTDFVAGKNTFQVDCTQAGSTALGRFWPQHLLYGVIFRVFWKTSKPHATGRITAPDSLGILNQQSVQFLIATAGPNKVVQVDYIGNYDDFNWRGGGGTDPSRGLREWQFVELQGQMTRHIGSATQAPWSVDWDNTWIPTQKTPFDVIALVRDDKGMVYVTEPVRNLTFQRKKYVVRYQATRIPRAWQSSIVSSPHSCSVNITGTLKNAVAAKIYMMTWNGTAADSIGINGQRLVKTVGYDHDLSFDAIDVPLAKLRVGNNSLFTASATRSHGIEVQWPGMEVFVRYDMPERWASYVPFGKGCVGKGGRALLSSRGKPRLGSSWTVELSNARPRAVALMTAGLSNKRWVLVDLPFDFTSQGAKGCFVYASMDWIFPVATSALGKAAFTLPAPNDAALLGASIYNQFIVVDPGANRINLVMSNGGRATFGH